MEILNKQEILNILAYRIYKRREEFELEGNQDTDWIMAETIMNRYINEFREDNLIGVLEDE